MFTKSFEKATRRWWEATLSDDETIEGAGEVLDALLEARSRSNRALEDLWATWRLPSAADVARVAERLDRVDRIEAALAGETDEGGTTADG